MTLLRVLAVLAALSLSACTCSPPIGDSAAQVIERCGTPAAVSSAPPFSPGLAQEEWRYGDVYVGLIAGHVAYILE